MFTSCCPGHCWCESCGYTVPIWVRTASMMLAMVRDSAWLIPGLSRSPVKARRNVIVLCVLKSNEELSDFHYVRRESMASMLPAWTPSIPRLFMNMVRPWYRTFNVVDVLINDVKVMPTLTSQVIRQNFCIRGWIDLLFIATVKCRLVKLSPLNVSNVSRKLLI